jgi:hypothetical protein
MATEPVASRPYMPGYGTLPPDQGTGLLPWSWAVERLTSSHDYWVATVWPDGRPQVSPVWGAWLDDAVWFSCSPGSRKARNLAAEPRCSVTTDNALEPVIVDGIAQLDLRAVKAFTVAVNAKYETDYTVEFFGDNHLYRVTPATVFALKEGDFEGSPTRWRFN